MQEINESYKIPLQVVFNRNQEINKQKFLLNINIHKNVVEITIKDLVV